MDEVGNEKVEEYGFACVNGLFGPDGICPSPTASRSPPICFSQPPQISGLRNVPPNDC